MGTLAYDPDRLAFLATALGTAVDDLDLLRSGDPEAQPALSVAAAAGAAFDGWRSTAVGISGCAALVDYRPIALEAGDIDLATEYVLATLYGWQTTTDPAGSTRTVPPEMEAAAIGYLLSHGEVALETPEQIASLQARLDAILADPAASAALAANLTAEGAAALVEQLASTRAAVLRPVIEGTTEPPELPDEIAAQIAAIDGIVGHLAATLVDSSAPLTSARELLGLMRPYSAALFISQMQAPSDVIGELAVDTMTRYAASFASDQPPTTIEIPDLWYLGIGDLLLPKVAAGDPMVANDVVRRLMDLNPSTLLETVRYPTSTTGLIARATDPTAIDVTTAGETIRRYLDFLSGPLDNTPLPTSIYSNRSAWEAQRGELAAVIAPWMMQFTARVEDWGWSDVEADDMLDWIVADEDVLGDLFARAGNWADGTPFVSPGDDPDALDRNLREIASMVGEIEAFLHKHAVENAKSRQAMWDFVVGLIPQAIGKAVGVLPLGKVANTIVVNGISYGIGYIADLAQEHGSLGSPPPLAEVLGDIDIAIDQSRAVAAYLSVGAMTDALVANHVLDNATWPPPPPDLAARCPSQAYLDSTTGWLEEQYSDDPAALATLRIALLHFLNDAGTARSCQELQFSGAAD